MAEFNTSLVREKIVFLDNSEDEKNLSGPTVIRSNRVSLKLGERAAAEKLVIRGFNMHGTLRMSAKVLHSYYTSGSFLDREHPFDWERAWDRVQSPYEQEVLGDKNWCAIYLNGRPVFKTKESPFVDVVEQCALVHADNYDSTMEVAEYALKEVGRAMKINHFSNVAAVFTEVGEQLRCGIIHRSEDKDTTFNYVVSGEGSAKNRIVQSFNVSAAFLEAINLQFKIQGLRETVVKEKLSEYSEEAKQLKEATKHQVFLNRQIITFEDRYSVKYRPEKPDFFGGM